MVGLEHDQGKAGGFSQLPWAATPRLPWPTSPGPDLRPGGRPATEDTAATASPADASAGCGSCLGAAPPWSCSSTTSQPPTEPSSQPPVTRGGAVWVWNAVPSPV